MHARHKECKASTDEQAEERVAQARPPSRLRALPQARADGLVLSALGCSRLLCAPLCYLCASRVSRRRSISGGRRSRRRKLHSEGCSAAERAGREGKAGVRGGRQHRAVGSEPRERTRADEGCEQRDEGVATTEHSRISPPAR